MRERDYENLKELELSGLRKRELDLLIKIWVDNADQQKDVLVLLNKLDGTELEFLNKSTVNFIDGLSEEIEILEYRLEVKKRVVKNSQYENVVQLYPKLDQYTDIGLVSWDILNLTAELKRAERIMSGLNSLLEVLVDLRK